jgi:mRNA interferase MazF
MGAFAAAEVVLIHFPFSDLKGLKLRPAVILADAGRGDWLLCQITSKAYGDPRSIQMENNDFAVGSLQLTSFARPAKLFTAHASLIAGQIGRLKAEKIHAIRNAVIQFVQTGGAPIQG